MLATLLLAQAARPADFGAHTLWDWVEAHASIVYPALAIGVIGLIVWALLTGFKAERLNFEQKSRLKTHIIQLMQRRISGVSAEAVAAELQIDLLTAASLLNELAQEGVVDASARAIADAPIHYRIRGR